MHWHRRHCTVDWPRHLLAWSVLCAIACTVVGLTACGRDAQSPPIAQVGSARISRAEVDHWASTIERGATPGNALGFSRGGSSRNWALRFLIGAKWLTGQAAAEGVGVSKSAVERTLHERIEISDEFTRELESTGQTRRDARLEIEAELAAEAIRRVLSKRTAEISPQELVVFYRHHRARFRLGEVRDTILIEGLSSRATAARIVRLARAGAGLTARVTNYETLRLEPPPDSERAAVLHAIFTAQRGVASLVRLDMHWAVFVVRHIFPSRPLSFAEARAEVAAVLVARRRRLLTADYLKAYRTRWTSKTSCRSGYVVQGCRQYHGPMRPEPDPFAGG